MSDVTQYFRSTTPAFQDVDDDTITEFVGDTFPQFLEKDQAFAKEYRGVKHKGIKEELGFTPEGGIKPFLEGGTGAQTGIGGQQILPSIGKTAFGALEGVQDLMSKSFPFRQVTEPLRRSIMGDKDPVKEFLAARRQSKSEDVQALETIGQATKGPALARHVTATAGSLAPSVAVAPLGFGAMVTSAGIQSYGAAFAEAKERGLNDNQAQLDGLVKGAITAIVTGGFGKTGIEILSRPSVREPITKAVAKVLGNAGLEATEEVTDEMLQLVYDIAVRGEPIEGAAYRALVAAVAGGLFGGGAATVQVISAARENMEGPRTPQDKLSQVGATRTAEAIAKPVQRATEPGEVALSKVTMEGGAFDAEGKPLPQETPTPESAPTVAATTPEASQEEATRTEEKPVALMAPKEVDETSLPISRGQGVSKTKADASKKLSELTETIRKSPKMRSVLEGFGLKPEDAYQVVKTKRGMWGISQTHKHAIAFAIGEEAPVSAVAVEEYGIKLPEGYVLEGDRYIFKGGAEVQPEVVAEPAPVETSVESEAVEDVTIETEPLVEMQSGRGKQDGFTAIAKRKGKTVGAIEADLKRDGSLMVFNSSLEPSLKGKRLGVEMYQRLLNHAQENGIPKVTSDSSVSGEAVRVYESLKRQGYDVQRNADVTTDQDGRIQSKDPNKPVFEVTVPKVQPEAVAPPVEKSPLQDAWDRFDDTGEIETARDLADAVDNLIADGQAPASLQRAVDRYRDAVEEDFRMAGRGDLETDEERFTEAVRKAAAKQKKPEAVPPPIQSTTREEVSPVEGQEIQETDQGQQLSSAVTEPPTPARPDTGRGVGIAISGPKWGRFFRAEGGLPVATFQSWVERTGKIKAMTRDITYATRDLYRALREAYGISRWRQIVSGFKSIPKADVEMLNEALADPDFDMSQIDERLHAPLNRMRQHVDTLSQHMVEQGLVDEELAATIEGNLGTYLARSYRIFDEADWVDRIPGEVFDAARNKVLGGLRAQNPDATPEDASRALRNMLEDWRQSGQIPGATTRRGGKLGSKDLSLFLQRKDISQEIRAVMGEYKNPVINFARTISKMARFIADQEFLGQVRAQGMGVFLFDPADAPAGFNTEIAAEGSSAMSPLNGLRTSREIAQAFSEFSKQGQVMEGWRLYFQLNAISKAAKTIGSLMTQQRNLMGQPFFWAASGHYDVRQVGKAFQAAMADMGLNNADKWRKYYKKMVRLGLAEDTARAEELREVMRDAKLDEIDPDQFAGKALGQFLRQAFIKTPIRIYQLSDEFGKMVGFENEKARLRRMHKDWSEIALEAEAARRTRLTYPTYSMAPDWIRKLRRVILFGPYITFPYEIFRTTFHNIRIGLSDISQTDNRQARRAGAERLAGTMLVTGSIGYGLQLLSQAIWEIADDEVEDLRRFLPEWSRNAQFVFLGKGKDGTLSYLNFSYLNPYNYLSDAVVAGLRGENVLESVLNGFKEFASPFTNEQMLSARVVDALRNKTQNGREIYNDQDDDDTKFLKIMGHILEALEPGTSQRLRERIIPSYRDRQPDVSGRQLDPVIETTSELSGLRMEKFDFVEGLKWNTRRFTKSEDNAESIFHQAAFRSGKSDTNALVDAYMDSDAKRFELWQDMRRDIDAAMRRGISEKDIKSMLKAERIPAYKVRALMDNRYVPLAVSDSARRRARERQSEAALESIKEYQKSRDGIPLE